MFLFIPLCDSMWFFSSENEYAQVFVLLVHICIPVGDSVVKKKKLRSHLPVYSRHMFVSLPRQDLAFQRHMP